jgi:ABC-2 type transport system ATP-binding protein
VLDEPTNGLDPQGIREMRSLLVELVESGTTVFLSSHLLGEVEMICTRAAMMSQGRLVAQDSIDRLLAPTGRVIIDTPDVVAAMELLARAQRHQVARAGERLTLQLDGLAPDQLNAVLVNGGVRVRELVLERRTLEDAFLGLTGGSGDARR